MMLTTAGTIFGPILGAKIGQNLGGFGDKFWLTAKICRGFRMGLGSSPSAALAAPDSAAAKAAAWRRLRRAAVENRALEGRDFKALSDGSGEIALSAAR